MIQNNLLFSITELSNLTGKTRPTIYKYVNAYDAGELDSIPYTFIKLFDLMSKSSAKRNDIVEFCHSNFDIKEGDSDLNEIIKLLKDNRSVIDIVKIKNLIEEEIKNGGTN